MDTNLWNIAFTSMIRQTEEAAWGNWTLDPAIVPGAVGILDPRTGNFSRVVDMIPGAKILELAAGQEWSVESSSVHQTESEVDFKGGYKDPSSGTEVKVGLNVAWSFAQKGSIVSKGTQTGRALLDDFGTLLQNQFPWLFEKAKSVQYATGNGIVQGFGVITQVTRSISGLNIGSLNESSTFSIVGSVDGINAMTGGGDVNVGIKGSYKETNESAAFESHLWPSEANKTTPSQIGISYQFASFDGKLIMPTWIMPLYGFAIYLDNAHGGTYIARCTATFDTPTKSGNTLSQTVPGGQQSVIDGIPLDATNLKLKVDFAAGSDFYFGWARPIATWLTGQRTIDMSGVWPWGAHAVERRA